MNFEKVKSMLGRRLLVALLVPAIMGCNFASIHASADETVAAMAEAENEEKPEVEEQDSAPESSEDSENGDNNSEGEGSEGGDYEGGDSEGGDSEGGDSEGGDSEGGDSEGDDTSDEEDASSTGATPVEGDNSGSGEGASTGASSEGAGLDSSTDATSTDGEGASDSSTDASSEDSADAASSASSEESAAASSSASDEDDWKDDEVSENSAGDVSDNDAEDEAEFEDIVMRGYSSSELSVIYKYEGDEVKSTIVYFPTDWSHDRNYELRGVSFLGDASGSDDPKIKPVTTAGNSNYYTCEAEGEIEASDIFVVTEKKNVLFSVCRNYVLQRKDYHNNKPYNMKLLKGSSDGGYEDFAPYPVEKKDSSDEKTSDKVYYVNPDVDGFTLVYCVENVYEGDGLSISVTHDNGSVVALTPSRIEDMHGKVMMDGDNDNRNNFMPMTPQKRYYTITSKDENAKTAVFLSGAKTASLHCTIVANGPAGKMSVGSDISSITSDVYIDNVAPKASVTVATREKQEDNDTDEFSGKVTSAIGIVGSDKYLDVCVTDDYLKDIEGYEFSYEGLSLIGTDDDSMNDNGPTYTRPLSVDGEIFVNGEGKREAHATIEFQCPGKYTIKRVIASDYANNKSEAFDEPITVIYMPGAPQLSLGSCMPDPYVDNGVKTYPFGSEVYMDVMISGGVFFTTEDLDNAIRCMVTATRKADNGNGAQDYTYTISDYKYGDATYSARLNFSGSGEYSVSVSSNGAKDSVGWSIDTSEAQGDRFVIASDIPNATKNTIKKSDARNGFYYNEAVIESVVFDKRNVDKYVYIENNEAGLPTKTPRLEFATEGNKTIAKAIMDEDGRYSFRICYKRYDWEKTLDIDFGTYVIDRTNPVISFAEVENFSANNGKVAPVINCYDLNMDKQVSEIRLTGSNNGEMDINSSVSESLDGLVISCADFSRVKANDDLYTLEAKVMDLAGNEAIQTLVFSVNRFGSVFVLGEGTKAMNNKYYVNDPQDVVVTEINVDDLVERNISVTRDGAIRQLNSESDYLVSRQGDDTTWKTFTYNVNKTNFAKDGVYSVTLYTKDRATNEMDNKSRDAEIEFAVDRTAPSIVVADIEDKGVYREKSHSFNVDVTDNMGLVSFTVYSNGKEIGNFTGKELAADDNVETITINESNELQNITLIAKDVAGNKQTVVFKDVRVSTSNKTSSTTGNKPSYSQGGKPGVEEADEASTGSSEQDETGSDISTTGIGGELTNDEFPYKTVGVVVAALACVAAAGGAGFMIRRKKKRS
ncbi:hypothetical protein [Butyrivibrio sp. AE3009]|uniref:hypothetical protein n=1 Tax=Butyrivibrio sp. AE3009 TaxID=1280666 RepID=UPI0003B6DE89|nr:hypothetical protein [Butyrivibrio sp. AE3009]